MSDTVESQFPELLPVVEAYLEDCKKTGKPMRVHLWDTNHVSELPRNVVSDAGLNELATKYGNPLYAIEDANASYFTDAYNKYVNGTPDQQKEVETQFETYTDQFTRFYEKLFKLSKSGKGRVFYPDPRLENADEQFAQRPENERIALAKFEVFVTEEQELRRATGKDTNINSIIIEREQDPETYERYKRHLNEEERDLIHQMLNPIVISRPDVDENIAGRINAEFKPQDVQITSYGAAHFLKNNDLDDLMPGLNIAIADTTQLNALNYIFLHPEMRKTQHKLPDYVLYADQHKMVKLDTDKAKAEFMGISEEEFRSWQRTIDMLDKSAKSATR